MRLASTSLWGFVPVSLLWLVACSDGGERPPAPPPPTVDEQPDDLVPECEPPPVVDKTGTCGADTVSLVARKPTLYFVLDTSGSMSDSVVEGPETKLNAAKQALTQVVTEVGHRIKYGLAAFPAEDDFDLKDLDPDNPPLLGCAAGQEVFSVAPGDPIECVNRAPNGPVLRSFKKALHALSPLGGTPLSPTLAALTPSLLGQEGRIAVVLLTDGSPNCNAEAECGPEECSANLFGSTIQSMKCDEDFNCCDPDLVGDYVLYPQAGCIDVDASEQLLSFLSNNGVETYVIGVLGSEDFDDVMNRLAIAGGQPREGSRKYYDVQSLSELSSVVRAIGANLSQSCEIELTEPPRYADEFNVYFDAEPIPADETDGWTLNGNVVTLHGAACDRIESGQVDLVELISGCKTIVK